ncbi:MAG: hypothetical protein RXS42_08650 [Nitrososphaeria archaeon]
MERSFGSLKGRVFFKDLNAGRPRIASLGMLRNMFSCTTTGRGPRRGWGACRRR